MEASTKPRLQHVKVTRVTMSHVRLEQETTACHGRRQDLREARGTEVRRARLCTGLQSLEFSVPYL